jgi:deoxyribodipyrimidine photolyase-like uncharacterized protein
MTASCRRFYWGAPRPKMACLAHAVDQTRDEAYAHHIQRLMVTGNFALLAGIDPQEVHEWYLAVYADAYEWVEAPNVIGMSAVRRWRHRGRVESPMSARGQLHRPDVGLLQGMRL